MIYLGTLGRMIGIKCPASQNVEHEERYTFQTTLEGRRKAQPRPIGRRTWSLQTSDATTPAQVAALMQFAQGAWGPGPFVFVPADAPYTNMLTPEIASCAPGTALYAYTQSGGPMQTPDGFAARSLINTSPSQLLAFGRTLTPASPGQSVTASAYVAGAGARVRIYFYDAGGGSITSATSSVVSDGAVIRSHITRVAPPGTASVRVLAIDTVQACNPAITWTDDLQPWADGQGCENAVVQAASRDLVQAVPGATYSRMTFTVSEVG